LLDMFDEKLAGPVGQHDGEEKHPAFDLWAPISRHRRIMGAQKSRSRRATMQRLAERFCTPYGL
jgi:hypothetical protein